jgi:predicted thioesterase
MKNIFKIGDRKEYRRVIAPEDIASFHGKVVHPVCATFALARDIEWTTRLFVLEICDDDEEGIGTMLTVKHESPAFIGEELLINAWIEEINGHELICSYEARVEERVVATGQTGQKIFKKDRIERLFHQHK